jgi:hypothetical protein
MLCYSERKLQVKTVNDFITTSVRKRKKNLFIDPIDECSIASTFRETFQRVETDTRYLIYPQCR